MNETETATDNTEEPSVDGIDAPESDVDKYYTQSLDSEVAGQLSRRKFVYGLLGVIILVLLFMGILFMKHNAATNSLDGHPVIVQITSGGFSPSTVTIAQGQRVEWINTDSIPHQPATDPFPLEDGLPGFRASSPLTFNQSYTYRFTQIGTFGYHDHLDPFQLSGKVVVH
jgi:plastocyanin